jgi:hypothetical protein
VKHLGVDVGVGYFGFIDTDMVRGADAHPAIGALREAASGPLAKTYPLSKAGKALAEGIEDRRRWVVVPPYARAMIVLRALLQPLVEREGGKQAPEVDRLFLQDVEERGAALASTGVGPGGAAAFAEPPETPRGGEAEGVPAPPESERAAR